MLPTSCLIYSGVLMIIDRSFTTARHTCNWRKSAREEKTVQCLKWLRPWHWGCYFDSHFQRWLSEPDNHLHALDTISQTSVRFDIQVSPSRVACIRSTWPSQQLCLSYSYSFKNVVVISPIFSQISPSQFLPILISPSSWNSYPAKRANYHPELTETLSQGTKASWNSFGIGM